MDNQYITHNDNSNREEEGSNKEEGSDKEEGNSTEEEANSPIEGDGENTDSEYSEDGGCFVANFRDKIWRRRYEQWSDKK